MAPAPSNFPIEKLTEWFQDYRRDLPWRNNASPYAVWVSEIMLQQTQVAVVIPYFEKWMAAFPSVKALAEASVDEVVKVWEGLGYYSRARNLHAGARQIMSDFGGEIPSNPSDLVKIKGIGPYTVGAICSFAFKQKEPAVDGNVMRVLSRYFAIEEDITKQKVQKKILALTRDILPDEEPWVFMEALIEFGALQCKKQAVCSNCPLFENCGAYSKGLVKKIPYKAKKTQCEALNRVVYVLNSEGYTLVRRCGEKEVMAGLYEFPYLSLEDADKQGDRALGLSLKNGRKLPLQKHSFTKYRVTLEPRLYESVPLKPVKGYDWVPFEELHRLPFSSGHRRILQHLTSLGTK